MLEIEIVEVNIIDGGVEVFARAWRDGSQLGFGSDGSVDIERFRFFNPPVLVDDANGTIERTYTDEDNNVTLRNLTEDPEEAILQSLEQTINLVGKDGSNIVPGKRGNTVSTIYSTGPDGSISTDQKSTWDIARDATTGDATDQTGDHGVMTGRNGNGTYRIFRGAYSFDTSGLGSDTINSATFSVFKSASGSVGDNDAQAYISVIHPTPASDVSLTTADYDQFDGLFGTLTEGIDAGNRSTAFTGTGEIAFPLNSTGLGWIDGSGVTWMGLSEGHDIEDLAISGTSVYNTVYLYNSDTAGTASDPKLVVTHTASAATNNALAFCSF